MVESAVIYRHIAMNGQPQSCKGNLRLIGEDDRRWLRRRYFVLGVEQEGAHFRALPYAFVWIATGKALQFSGYRGVTDRACAGNGPTIFP